MTAGEEDITDHRPVYILGAGFSKAICNEMPLLNALGQQALNLLPKASRESISFREGESFEQWLSMRTQDMPFLPDHENMRRRAVVELLLAAAIISRSTFQRAILRSTRLRPMIAGLNPADVKIVLGRSPSKYRRMQLI